MLANKSLKIKYISFALIFHANPSLRVPTLEYPPDIHLTGSGGHFQLST